MLGLRQEGRNKDHMVGIGKNYIKPCQQVEKFGVAKSVGHDLHSSS